MLHRIRMIPSFAALALSWASACKPAPSPPEAATAQKVPGAEAPGPSAPAVQPGRPDAPPVGAAGSTPAPTPDAPATPPAHDVEARSDCTTDPRVTPFSPHLRLTGQTSRLEVVGVMPPGAQAYAQTPPQMGLNALQVRVSGAHGRPMPKAQVTLRATMPDHAHGGSEVHAIGTGPIKQLHDIDLMMPGVWRLEFEVAAPHHAKDTVAVHLCIPG